MVKTCLLAGWGTRFQ